MSLETPVTRRSFAQRFALSISGFLGSLAGVSFLAGGASARGEPAPGTKDEPKARWGMAIDLDRCTACGACAVACHTENNVPTIGPAPELRGAEIDWMKLLPQSTGSGHKSVCQILNLTCYDSVSREVTSSESSSVGAYYRVAPIRPTSNGRTLF